MSRRLRLARDEDSWCATAVEIIFTIHKSVAASPVKVAGSLRCSRRLRMIYRTAASLKFANLLLVNAWTGRVTETTQAVNTAIRRFVSSLINMIYNRLIVLTISPTARIRLLSVIRLPQSQFNSARPARGYIQHQDDLKMSIHKFCDDLFTNNYPPVPRIPRKTYNRRCEK